ncbi:unnamed protein product, partial [Ilex paraguariensis]
NLMMIRTLSPYTGTPKTAEIMARYRPIAPKPEVPVNTLVNQNIRQSDYLRNVWPHLLQRPTRTRKRGRPAISPPNVKRQRTCLQALYLPYQVTTTPPSTTFCFNAFPHAPTGLLQLAPLALPMPNLAAAVAGSFTNPCTMLANLLTVSLLSCPPSLPITTQQATKAPEHDGMQVNGGESGDKDIDLNIAAEAPEEHDFLLQLQNKGPISPNIIAPQPVRPIGSCIYVTCISEDPGGQKTAMHDLKKPEDVEREVESEALPAIVSDSNNRVRLVNSAYKEMVGQPECSWLDTAGDGRRGGGACKRIGGEVMLQFLDSILPVSSIGFSCWVKIEWRSKGTKNSVNAFCDAIRLPCESKDYLFAWRFHTRDASQSASSF